MVFITAPNAERTFAVYLGAALELVPEDLKLEYFEGYDYDFDLLEHYIQMLGKDNFYGFQFHEWCSNYKSDIGKISGLPKDTVWTEKTITDEINRVFKMPYLFVESMSAAEMAEYGNPTNADAFLKVLLSHFAKRTKSKPFRKVRIRLYKLSRNNIRSHNCVMFNRKSF